MDNKGCSWIRLSWSPILRLMACHVVMGFIGYHVWNYAGIWITWMDIEIKTVFPLKPLTVSFLMLCVRAIFSSRASRRPEGFRIRRSGDRRSRV